MQIVEQEILRVVASLVHSCAIKKNVIVASQLTMLPMYSSR